ncbi:MAG: branched-chain amino acid ABC transporter permease [Acutalibacteraceae bacterium]
MAKLKGIKKIAKSDFMSYGLVTLAFLIITILSNADVLGKNTKGLLIPVCCYIVMAVSLNLTVGIMGELSLGHAGFMSIGAFSGVIMSMSLADTVESTTVRLILGIIVGAVFAAVFGLIIGIPVLRLHGDYLAIVTLAFGEIIKDFINCLIVGVDSNGLHVIFNFKGDKSVADLNLLENGKTIIKGAQGATGIEKISTFTAGFVLIIIALIIVQNLIRSRAGRAIISCRDNRIAAESVGINVMKYKLSAFIVSAGIAGAAGALYGMNYSSFVSSKFDFNTSILILVFVVLGGLGNIMGSVIAATVLYILPEALREFSDYRMLIYAIILIIVMVVTNNPQTKALRERIIGKFRKGNSNE